MDLQKTNYKNDELNVEINCYVDKKNQIWFKGKEIALILEYKDTKRAIQNHVHQDDKKLIDFKIKQRFIRDVRDEIRMNKKIILPGPKKRFTRIELNERKNLLTKNKEWFCDVCKNGINYTLSSKNGII